MSYEVKDVSGQYGANGEITRTIVTIYQQQPYFSTAAYPLNGDHTHKSHEELLALIKAEFFKEHYTAYAFKELDKSVAEQSEVIDKLAKLSEVTVLDAVTNTDNPVDPTIYKRYLDLVELAKIGTTYQAYDIFALVDESYTEQFGEGKRVLVQVNKEFTYNGEPVAEFLTGGQLELAGTGVAYRWTKPKN